MLNSKQTAVLSRNGDYYFGFMLKCIVSPKLFGVTIEKYSAELHSHQIDLLNCLIRQNSDKMIFEIRIISKPDPENYARGKIIVGLLCKSKNSKINQAVEYASHLYVMLKSYFLDTNSNGCPHGKSEQC